MVHEYYKEMLAPYALSTLDGEEMRAVEAHLRSCRECQREVDEWQETVAALALGAGTAEPSPRVREQILESVRAERITSDVLHGRSEKEREPGVIRFPPTAPVWSSTRKFAAIAATFVLLALLTSIIVLWKQNRSAQSEIAKLSAEKAVAQQELDRQRKVVELLSAPGANRAVLSGTSEAPNAHATLAYDRQTGQAVLLTEGLTRPPSGKAYQLWFIVDNLPMPGKVFNTDSTGKAITSDHVPSEALRTAVFAITLEPATGVKSPTGPIYLRSSL